MTSRPHLFQGHGLVVLALLPQGKLTVAGLRHRTLFGSSETGEDKKQVFIKIDILNLQIILLYHKVVVKK